MHEEQVICCIQDNAEAYGFGERIGRARVGGRGRGIDICFEDAAGLRHAFEAKGSHHSWGRCQKYFDDGFARLPQMAFGLKELRIGGIWQAISPHKVSLVVPANGHFERHAESFIPAFVVLGYGLYYAHPDHLELRVEPRLIGRAD